MLAATIILCFTFFVLIFFYSKTIKRQILDFIALKKLPAPPDNNPIVGNILYLHTSRDNVFKKLREWGRQYYPIYNIRVLHINAACLVGPEDFERILSNPKHIEKSIAYDLLHDWLGTGLLTSGGRKWMTRRRILTPAFHFSILQQFVNIFNEETDKLVDIFKEVDDQSCVPINPHITQFTLKTIAESAMGTKLQFNTEKEVSYKRAVFTIGDVLLYRLIHTWLIYKLVNFFSPKFFEEKKALKVLHNFTREVIAERERTFEKIQLPTEDHEVYTGKRRLAMLDLLITAKNEEGTIDDEGIREEVDTFMFEGHDTTAAALNFAFMLIACNKHVQEQIVEEIGIVLGDARQKPTYKDLQEMKYLERAVKEVLRLYPSVHFISRKLGDDLITGSGYKLPKGTITHLHIYDLHHNPDIYPDPERFDPDRFLPENCQNRHPFAYLPFSAGPRNCVGQKFAMLELKAAICGVLANFVLEPVDTPDTIVLVVDLVLRTKDPIRVKFVPRI
jgi:cytochrome P450 family 4